MTSVSWKTGQNDLWTNAAAWVPGTVPGSADDVTIGANSLFGTPYTVTLQGSAAVQDIDQTQADATLAVASGTLSVAGTYALAAGTLQLDDATLNGGTYASTAGTVLLDGRAVLSNLAWDGTLAIARGVPSGYVQVALSNDVIAGVGGAGVGTLILGQNVLATLGSPNVANLNLTLDGASLQQASGTLALGSQSTLTARGLATLGTSSGSILNEGEISATGSTTSLFVDASAFLNQGTLTVGDGARLFLDADSIGDPGQITIGSGGYLRVQTSSAGRFVNTGFVTVAGGTLSLDTALTTAELAGFPVGTGTLAIGGTLDNAGATLRSGAGTARANLMLEGGTITGGTIVNSGAFSVGQPPPMAPGASTQSELSGVNFDGTLSLGAAPDAQLAIANGLTVHGLDGTGPGTIDVSGGATLSFLGSQVLDNATIDIGSPGYSYFADTVQSAGTLTLGTHARIVQTGMAAGLGSRNDATLVVNAGTIAAAVSGGTFALSSLANTGLIAVSGGGGVSLAGVANSGTIADISGRLSVQGSLVNTGLVAVSGAGASYDSSGATLAGLRNAGTLSVGPGATANLGACGTGWSNSGTLAVAGGEMSVGGTFTRAQLGAVQVTHGGTLALTGTLLDGGTALATGDGTALGRMALQAQGTVQGGTIIDAGHGILAQGGTLSGVVYDGTLSLDAALSQLTIVNGITTEAAAGSLLGSIVVTGAGSVLRLASTETLDRVALSLGAAGTGATLDGSYGQTLTLGTQASVRQAGATAAINADGGSIVNQGSISASQPGGTLSLTGNIDNAGTIAVSNGDTLALSLSGLTNTGMISVTGGVLDAVRLTVAELGTVRLLDSDVTVTGTLTATGGTVSAGGAMSLLKLIGEVVGGTIHDGGNAVQFVGASTLDGVTYQGALSINRPFATVTVQDGLTLRNATGTGPGSLSLTGAGSTLVWDSRQALDNAVLTIGCGSAAYGAPALVAEGGAAPPLLLGSHLRVQQAGTYASIGDSLGGIASAATITANLAHGQMMLRGDHFTNAGTIGISNTDTVTAGAAGFLNAGLIVVGVGSALDLDLTDYFASGSLADQSFTNTGTIVMAGGMLAEPTGNGVFPNVPMRNTQGASIVGAGVVASQVANHGVVEARGGVLELVQAVSGTGHLQVDAGAMLVLGSVSAGQTARFAGTGGTLALRPLAFLGSIAGFTAGDTLDLLNTSAHAATFSGDTLDVMLTSGATLHLATSSAMTGGLSVTAGTHGDALIRFAAPVMPHTLPDTTALTAAETAWARASPLETAAPTLWVHMANL